MNEQHEFEDIQAFIKREMSLQEAEIFAHRISQDEKLHREVSWHRLIRDGLQLVAEEEEKVKPHVIPPKRNWSFIALAAIVLLLLSTAPWWLSMVKILPEQGIPSQQHQGPGFSSFGEEDKLDSLSQHFLSPALLQADAKHIRETVRLNALISSQATACIEQMITSVPERINSALLLKTWFSQLPVNTQDSLSLFAALVHLNANQFYEAKSYLDISKNKGFSTSMVEWYEMLIHFKTGEWESANTLLQRILIDSQHVKHEEALRLAKELKITHTQ